MKLIRPHRSHSNTSFMKQSRDLCNSTSQRPTEQFNSDDKFVAILRDILRGKQSWKVAFNNSFILDRLESHHVEKVLIQTVDDPRIEEYWMVL